MRIHTDKRRHFVGDIFPGAVEGDVNVVYLNEGIPIAWHRHQKQTDYMFCIQGTLLVGIAYPEMPDAIFRYMTPDYDPSPIIVPANHWHGYEAVGGKAILLSYITRKYDPEDEERAPLAEYPWPTTA